MEFLVDTNVQVALFNYENPDRRKAALTRTQNIANY